MSNKIISRKMLVKTSVEDNNNKFWEGILYEDNTVFCRWGRVGADGQKKSFPAAGAIYLERKVREKEGKGYKEIKSVDSSNPDQIKIQGSQLKEVAKKQIKHNSNIIDKLIEYLVNVNRHDIVTASGGKLTVDMDSGLIKTDVGVVVTLDTLDRARNHLLILSKCLEQNDFRSKEFIQNLNEYLMAIPQKVGSRRGWEAEFLKNQTDIQKQSALIDSMESTLKAIANKPIDDKTSQEEVFNVELFLIENKEEINRVDKLYRSTLQSNHASSHLRIKNIYQVNIVSMLKAFNKHGAKLTPVMELWHGTRAANVLSILKSGLVIPPANAAHCSGRMFSDGAYFSDRSTKSLNYSYGYWDTGQKDNQCYMFLAQVGLGKYYVPSGSIRQLPKGYDSVFAQAHKSGVINNEMVVPNVSQCNLTHLVEFST